MERKFKITIAIYTITTLASTMFLTGSFAEIMWTTQTNVSEFVLIWLLWILFPSREMKLLLIPLSLYFLIDYVSTFIYYFNEEAYNLINQNYNWMLILLTFITITYGVITTKYNTRNN